MPDFHDYLESLMRGDMAQAEYHLMADRESFTFPTAKPQWAPARQYDIKMLTIDWMVDIEHERVDAISKMEVSCIVPETNRMTFHAAGMDISGISDSNGNELGFDTYEPDNRLVVYLSKPLKRDQKEELTFTYTLDNPQGGLYFTNPCPEFPDIESSFWTQMQDDYARYVVPVYDNPSHKFPVQVILTVPDGYFAMSNGRLKEHRKNDDGTETFHWLQDLPIPAYLLTMAASKYVEYKEEHDGLEVSYYAHEKWDKETVYRSFGKTPEMIRFFEEKLGVKFPWAKYAQVTAANFTIGGMENVSATTQTDGTLHDEKTHKDYQSDALVAHELAHQWGGDLVTCRTWSHGWLNEGWGTQMQNEWKLHDKGMDEYLYDQYGKQKAYFEEDKKKYRRPIVKNEWERGSDVFDRHLYPGAAWRYYMLKHLVGEERWWEILGEWLTRYAYQSVYTHDLESLFTEMTGEDYGWFFEQWLYKAGYPECKIKCSHDQKLGHALVKIEQTHDHDDDMTPEAFRFPLTVEFVAEDGSRTRYTMEVTERIHSFYYPVKNPPEQIVVDPDYAVLMDWDIEKPESMWIEQLRRGGNLMQRIKAVHALGKKGSQESLEALGEILLRNEFWGLQAEVAKALGEVKTDSALDHLLKGADLPDSRARTAVARALGEFFQDERAFETLKKLSEDNESYFVVSSAAASIGKTKHEQALEFLKRGLKNAPESWHNIIKQGYLKGLGETDKEKAIDIVKKYLEKGTDDYLRRIIPELLVKLGKKYKKKHSDIKEILEKLLYDKSYRVRGAAILATKTYGDSSLISTLTRIAETEVESSLVRAARVSIRELKKKQGKDEVDSLKKSVEKLERENRELKDRMSKIEAQMKDRED
ncbi:hypothetical protein EU537_04070 [Candidatus Thorarchaeota archaeon]|nr:MAG: hypothetical protein EU537_04070 [Candidatus Thorarchaeota archaeon]